MSTRLFVAFAAVATLALAASVAGAAAVQIRRAASAPQPGEGDRYVSVRGGKMHVLVLEPPGRGSGRTLVLLHGASGNLGDLRESIGRRLAARHRVILIDRPGHGGSDRLGLREMASPARQGDAIAETLDAMGVGKVVVVAHSWAGSVATNLALNHPDHVAGLVLLSPATHPYPGGAAWYNNAASTPVLGYIFAATIAAPVGLATIDKAVAGTFAPRQPPPDYVERTGAKSLLRPGEFTANAEDLVDLNDYLRAQSPRYGEIKVPTTIVTSDKDGIVGPEVHARPLHRQIEGSKLVVVKDAGHMTHWTATDRVIDEVDALAAKTRP